MTDVTTTADALALRSRFRGRVLVPGEEGYDGARTIFNAMIDRRPAVIAQCADAADVATAIAFGREQGLPIAVRSGGHSVAGAALVDGGLVIDLRRLDGVRVDPDTRTLTVGGGATWGPVDRACQPYGLATSGGRVSTTGVTGLTLGGGDGWLARKLGLACDNLLSVTLTTADGSTVRASEDLNPDLFWALHGGGGNFGVATELQFRLQPLPATTFGLLVFDPEDGPKVLARYRDLIEGDAPDELGGGLVYATGPAEEFVPEHLVDRLILLIAVVYAGTEADTREAIRPLLDLGPAGHMITEMRYADIQCALDDPPGYRNYWSAEHLASFPDAAVEAFCNRAPDMIVPSPSQHVLFPWGGSIASRAGDWPIANRSATWCVHPFGLWDDPADDERAIAWAKAVRADMAPFSTGGAFLNYIADEGRERTIAGYGGQENYRRLATVKAEFDPDNVFRMNHNIDPAS